MCNLIRFIAIAVASLAVTVAAADVVTLHDGRIFTGKIIEDSPRQVVIKTVVHGIESTLTFQRSEVAAAERDAETVNAPTSKSKHSDIERDSDDRTPERGGSDYAPPTRYLVVPIVGTIGEDVLASAVAETIDHARRRGIEHLVFVIDTPGGAVDEASQIARVMREAPPQIRMHAYVKAAISAGIWVAFSCDDIAMTPSAQMGGAVAYSRDRSTGAAEVDKKMNSILAAEIASYAERIGVPATIPRAMVLPEVQVFAIETPTGEVEIVDQKPSGDVDYRVIDDENSVLTLTALEAERLGISKVVDGAEAHGAALGFEAWEQHSRYGETAMAKAAQALAQRRARVASIRSDAPAVLRSIDRHVEEAVGNDPNNFSYTYYTQTGKLTEASRDEWQQHSRAAISSWNRVLSSCREYMKMVNEGWELGIDLEDEVGVSKSDIQDLANRAGREISRLQREFNKSDF